MVGQMMDYPLNTSDIIRNAAIRNPQKEIVSALPNEKIHRYTVLDAYKRIAKLANFLTSEGVPVATNIATLAVNHYRHLELYFATPAMGAVIHTLNSKQSPEQLVSIINHAEDTWLFIDPEFIPLVESIYTQISIVKNIVVLCAEKDMPSQSAVPLLCYEQLIIKHSEKFDWPRFKADSPCGLCYTMGTTGAPKGVLYEHGSTAMHATVSGSSQCLNFTDSSVVMPIVSMSHAVGWGIPYSAMLYGAKLILPGCPLNSENIQGLIETEEVTIAIGVPSIWAALHEYLEKTELTIDSLTTIGVGGIASPKEMVKIYAERYQIYWMGIWGLTETSPLATASIPTAELAKLESDQRYALQASAGKPLFGIEIEIFDALNRAVPHDGKTLGHLRVRGACVAKHYFRDEHEKCLIDGWLDTGDIATITEGGYLNIVDRSKDVIKSGGQWISTVELEAAARQYDAITEACVIGALHEKWGERPIMLVTVAPESDYCERSLVHELQRHVSHWWLPDAIIVVEKLPHTAIGKLKKVDVREK